MLKHKSWLNFGFGGDLISYMLVYIELVWWYDVCLYAPGDDFAKDAI